MKKVLYLVLLISFLIAAYFITVSVFPKSAGRLPFFAILFALDFYLWFSIKKKIFKLNSILKYVLICLYWAPFVLVVFLVLFIAFYPLIEWNISFQTYLFGIIFIVYVSKLIPVIFLLFSDIIRLFRIIFRFFSKPEKKGDLLEDKKISRSKFLQYVGFIGGGIAFSGLLIGMLKWVYDFKIIKKVIKLPDLPSAFNSFRIVQFSDLHLGSWTSKKRWIDAVGMINDLNPDVVFFTGDLVNYTTQEAFGFRQILKEIKASYGIYAVLGNHDYGDYKNWKSAEAKKENMELLYDFYKDMDWKLLRNESYILELNGDKIGIIGVENWGAYLRFQKHGNIKQAIKGVENIPVKLLLSHDPSYWEKEISKSYKDIEITFSGHTHGFQFGIEIPGIKWSPAQYLYKQWAGLYSKNNNSQYVYVNRGLGSIGYPGRIGILPEITLFVLEK